MYRQPYEFKQGYREDLPWPVRSSWEANVGRILQLMVKAESLLKADYEPYRIEFPIKRGCRDYLPDWIITEPDGTERVLEVKGRLDSRSKTKLKRLRKYHQEIFNAALFVVRFDPLHQTRRARTTAHSWLYLLGARRFWFYDELKKKFRGLVRWE